MTKRQQELLIAQNKFLGKCPICGTRLKKKDGINILCCTNSFCAGVNGESFYKILSDKKMKAYYRLFKNN